MDPLTAGLILANTLAQLDLIYVEGLSAAQKAERSTRIYDLIDRVLTLADQAQHALHPTKA
jgi:hypothetical protein